MGPSQSTWFFGVFSGIGAGRGGGWAYQHFCFGCRCKIFSRWDVGLVEARWGIGTYDRTRSEDRDGDGGGGSSNTYMTSSWPPMTHKERDFTV